MFSVFQSSDQSVCSLKYEENKVFPNQKDKVCVVLKMFLEKSQSGAAAGAAVEVSLLNVGVGEVSESPRCKPRGKQSCVG